MNRTGAFLTLLAGSISGAWAGAQDLAPLSAGTRVRVTAPAIGVKKLAGSLESTSRDSICLRIAPTQQVLVVPRTALAKLEVSQGEGKRGRAAVKGLGIGAAAGAVAGVLTIPSTCPHTPGPCEDEFPDWFFPVAFAAVAAPAGALIGALLPAGERWKRVRPERLYVGVMPTGRRGVAVRVSASF